MALSDNQVQGASAEQTYRFEIKIGSRDLSHDLYRFNIITSVQLPYQTFELGFVLDQNDLILDKIYGQEPIKISVILDGETGIELSRTDFELIFLDTVNSLTNQVVDPNSSETKQTDRVPINFTALSKKAYTTMNYYINDIFHAKTMSEIIKSLVEKTGAQLVMDPQELQDKISQVLIPPTTLYQSFSYLNQLFGIYDGVPVYFCSHDNKVYMKNLTKKITTSDAFTIYQLALDSDEDIYKDKKEERTYISWGSIKSNYKGNSVVAAMSPSLRYIVKPKDRLFQQIDIDIDKFTKDYGIVDKDSRIFYDKTTLNAENRKATYISQTGDELSHTFINASLSRHISDLTTLDMVVNRNFYLLNFMDVGEAVNFISQTSENNPISGKYILKSSLIGFSKLSTWEASASISLIRSNKNAS
jgi:hypothetical protein